MALSFEESKKQALKRAETPMLMSLANDAIPVSANETFSRDTTGR